MENTNKYNWRHLARIVVEAKTPLAIGCGEKNIITDSFVAIDVNGLPYIPGTSIAGVLRSMFDEYVKEKVFGFQRGNDGKGSELICSDAKIMDSNAIVIDGLDLQAIETDELLRYYKNLPIRQHVRINSKGTAENHGKFDEQVVFAGTRFCFELELLSETSDLIHFNNILNTLYDYSFRLGSGSRSGFGEVSIVSVHEAHLNLKELKDLESYLEKSSNLQESANWSQWKFITQNFESKTEWIQYELKLKPDDFFLFGSGYGDQEADITPVRACRAKWINGKGSMETNQVLIPASSIKGALSHRVAFHYNKNHNRYIGCGGDYAPKVGCENEAVRVLFGYEDQTNKKQVRGNVLFSDIINHPLSEKTLSHVSIDRFTGGARDGALFQEKTIYAKDNEFTMNLFVNKSIDQDYIKTLECALKDVCNGMLPLGGGINRGNGIFNGYLIKNGVVL